MRSIHFSFYSYFILWCITSTHAGIQFNLPNPIGSSFFAPLSGLFFVGSSLPSTNNAATFALAVAGRGNDAFTGIAPETIFINGLSQPNPLFGAQIDLLSTTGKFLPNFANQTDSLPVVTVADDPNHIYIVTSYTAGSNPTLVISNELSDALGNPASGINALTGSVQGVVFAAVSPQAGTFGDPGSGITSGNLLVTQTNGAQITFSAIAALDRNSVLTALGSPLQSMIDPLLYASNYKANRNGDDINIGTLFIGCNIITGTSPSNGGLAVVSTVGPIGTPLRLMQIAFPSAITSDSIVGAIGADIQIYTHFLSTLFPSVGTQYLIVVGGVGTENADPVNVYALPLTSSGLLASINSAPTVVASNGYFLQREFTVPAMAPGDLYTSSSIPAQVGGGSAPGTITSLYSSGDSVIITVTGSTTQASGIYYSQAIFDISPKIIGWTPWQRAVYSQGTPETSVYDQVNAQFWYTTAFTSTVNSVVRTQWDKNGTQLAQLLNSTVPLQAGGIQGVIDLPATTPFFSSVAGERSSAALFTGLETVILAETGADISGLFTPVISYPNAQNMGDGTLQTFSAPAEYIGMTGGVLSDLSAIIAATIVTDGIQSWIVIGGNGGLAVLASADGTGIINGSITQNFSGLSSHLIWQKLGDYRNVRKLVSQNGFLYILTDTLFERIEISPALINKTEPFIPTNLATASTLPNKLYLFFSDVLISEPLVVLATSSGLLRGGNGVSVQTALTQQQMDWTEVIMPETTGCATRLLAVTQTGQAVDLYQESPAVSGNLYVLAGNVSLDQARIYRYVVNYNAVGINDSTLQLFNDYFVISEPTFFINIGYYRNFFYTDGLLWSTSRSRYILEKLFAQQLPLNFKTGSRARVTRNDGFFTDADAHSIGSLERLCGLGSWVIPGDFGLVVHH